MFPFLKPNLIYDSDVTRVTLNDIKKLEVEGLILDLDNTIMAPKSARLDLPVQYWLDVIKKHFKVVVLTNNKKAFYLEAVREVLQVPVIGFATYGEIARFSGTLNGFHNATAVVCALPE